MSVSRSEDARLVGCFFADNLVLLASSQSKFCAMFFASWRCIIETDREVQLGIAFTSDGKQDKKLDVRSGTASNLCIIQSP